MMRGAALLALAGAAQALPRPAFMDADVDGSSARRQLQSTPDRCSDDASYQAWLALVNSACCTHAESQCANGLPTSARTALPGLGLTWRIAADCALRARRAGCDLECANVLKPFQKSCKSQLRAAGITDTVKTAARACPATQGASLRTACRLGPFDIRADAAGSRGCPKNIPSVNDHGAEQSCGTGSGFWPIGSVCMVTCAAGGGGHRRAQAGGSAYLCTQGGNWLSVNPISCGGGSGGAPAPPSSPTQGRFVAVPTPMNINAAVQYCRSNYAALASIHSIEEQRQAAAACASFANEDGSTVSDQASNGGYGCWIGFEDSAAEGGFVWTDGSSVDFVRTAIHPPSSLVRNT